jgi:hypothetical protein
MKTTPATTLGTETRKDNARNWFDWFEAAGPKTWSNWALVILGVIAGFLARGTLKATRINAETLVRQNSPYLGLYGFELDRGQLGTPARPTVYFTARNYNKALAFNIEISVASQWGNLREFPTYEAPTSYAPYGVSFGYMEQNRIPIPLQDDIATIDDINERFRRDEHLFVYGFIRCSGALGQKHKFGFAFECFNEVFRPTGGSAYNFHCTEQPARHSLLGFCRYFALSRR